MVDSLGGPTPIQQPQQRPQSTPAQGQPAAEPGGGQQPAGTPKPETAKDGASLTNGKAAAPDKAAMAKADRDTDAAMKAYDKNQDGKIDDAELDKWVKEKGGDKDKVKDFTDADKDGSLGRNEIRDAYDKKYGSNRPERLAELAKETDASQTNNNS